MNALSNVRTMRPATHDDLRKEWEPTHSLDRYIAEGKADAEEWARLNAEWDAPQSGAAVTAAIGGAL